MAEKFQGDSDWLTFGHVSIYGGILISLLEEVGGMILLSVSQRMHYLLERGVLLLEERKEWLLEDKYSPRSTLML